MTTTSERAAHAVNQVIFISCLCVILVVSHFDFEGGTLDLIAPVPGHCLPLKFTLQGPYLQP